MLAASCSGEQATATSGGFGGQGGSATGAGGHDAGTGAHASSGTFATGTGASGSTGSSGCTSGEACGDGGVCTADGCCEASRACGDVCCAQAEVCSFQRCVTPGATCHDSTDCADGDYCEFTLGDNADGGTPDASCPMGVVLLNGKCLPRPPTCAPDAGTPDGGALTCLEACEFHPTGTFNPVVKASWGGQLTSPFATDVMMAPIVIALADTNCDGKVNAQDIPDIVFTSFTGGNYNSNGTLHSIRMVGGALVDQWSAPIVYPAASLAAGDIDGLPGNEVVACGDGNVTNAYKGDGTLLWSAPYACYMPSIADIDGDGTVEVIVEGGILDGATGALKHAFAPPLDGPFIVSDLDGDGELDVITADRGYHADGTLFVDTQLGGNWPAIADFDRDGVPEVVLVDTNAHTVALWRYDATQPQGFTLVRAPVDMNQTFPTNHCPVSEYGASHGGGPPTVADFNGDGIPDIGLAGGIGYVVFDGKKLLDPTATAAETILWAVPTTDCSSAQTGSSVFDFQGTGEAQVVYSDEEYLRIYDGATGNVLFQACNTTGTLVELPVIADVDNDGHADIVVVSNAYASGNAEYQCDDGANIAQAGVRVFGDANGTWVRTPPVWNEHAYPVTNITPDGVVPQHEPANYTAAGLDNFRQNKQPGSEFSRTRRGRERRAALPGPDRARRDRAQHRASGAPCGRRRRLLRGHAAGDAARPRVDDERALRRRVESVIFTLTNPDAALTSGQSPVYAVADDGMPSHPSWHECRTDNNTSTPVSAACPMPH